MQDRPWRVWQKKEETKEETKSKLEKRKGQKRRRVEWKRLFPEVSVAISIARLVFPLERRDKKRERKASKEKLLSVGLKIRRRTRRPPLLDNSFEHSRWPLRATPAAWQMSIPSLVIGAYESKERGGCFEGALLPRLSGRQKREKRSKRGGCCLHDGPSSSW